ncbi:alpha/beta hydrolase fold domain-containing protein [Colwellia sp. E150_009]
MTRHPKNRVTVRSGLSYYISVYTFSPISNQTSEHELIYYHGGGFVIGSGQSYWNYCQYLADKTQCKVHLIDYRLAPENKFPCAYNDCFEATKNILFNDPNHNYSLVSDSVGGSLLLATLWKLNKEGYHFNLRNVSLISPLISASFNGDWSDGDILNKQILKYWLELSVDYNLALFNEVDKSINHINISKLFISFGENEIFANSIKSFINRARGDQTTLISYECLPNFGSSLHFK